MLDKKTHTYTNAKGERRVGVTTIIKYEGLMGDMFTPRKGVVPSPIPEYYKERGSIGHEVLDHIDSGRRVLSYPEYVEKEVQQYLRFKKETGFEVEFSEQEIENPVLNYMGTADKFGMLRGGPVCIDVKFYSGYGVRWHEFQTIGYTMGCAFNPKLHKYIKAKRYGLILHKDKYLLVPHTKVADIERKWTALCVAYHAKKELGLYDVERDLDEIEEEGL